MSAMDNIVLIFHRTVYGVIKVYPANDTARKFAELLGIKTFNAMQLRQIRGLGFEVAHTSDPKIEEVA